MTGRAETVKEVLVAARWILENAGWCQNACAKRRDGFSVSANSTEAVSFCAIGATYAVECDYSLAERARRRLLEQLPMNVCNVTVLNDQRGQTKEGILAFYDAAIAKL